MIYNQGERGWCSGYGIANGMEQTTGKCPSYENIEAFFRKWDTDGREGMRTDEMMEILKEEDTLAGYKVDFYEEVYHTYKPKTDKEAMHKIRTALSKPYKAVIISLRIRGSLELDDKNVMIKKEGKYSGFHALLMDSWWLGKNRKNLGFKLENSWGEEWGEEGSFYLRLRDFWTEVHDVIVVSFTKA